MELVDFERFVWRNDEKVPGRLYREAGGGEVIEDIWKLMKHGEQNLFLGVYASLAPSVSLSQAELLAHTKSAWKSLRWEVPTIASSTAHIWHEGRAPTTFITYDLAKNAEDVNSWVDETVKIFPEYAGKTLDELRYDIGQEPIPANDLDRQTFLYLVPFSAHKFGLLMHTAHTTFDGAGVKILMTKLLGHLAQYATDAAAYKAEQAGVMRWGEEGANLLPIITEVLKKREGRVIDDQGNVIREETAEEYREGKEYFETLGDIMNGFGTGYPSFLPFDPATSKPKTRRVEHKFTAEESTKIQEAGRIKGGLTERLTVNHLVHAACCLLPIYDNPPAPDSDGLIFFFGLMDGRQRLDAPYRTSTGYPGYCLGVSALQIPVSTFHRHPPSDKKALIIDFAKEVKREYAKQAAYPALVAVQVQEGELMLQAPPAPPFIGPQYGGDGKGAVYLRPEYEGKEGETVIDVDDFFVGLNKCDPGPFFRCTEWKGRIMLSVDYNEFAVEEKVMKGWLQQWVDLLLALTV
ncbi:hypothetical protein BDN70DRAFT_808554 [Pholiota conissans]|uniref:Uncharacterized protein n=1 Tax=Pholiota conissans TaxID=109636 RepID=A0A9P5YZH4_9AGAR|nr:hypothetical protein BDN70DRAFT_808554 [Pholiota conissans]